MYVQEWGVVDSDMIVLAHLKEVLTGVLRLGISAFRFWEPLSVVQSRPQPWLWKSFLVPNPTTPNDCSSPGLEEGLKERDTLREEGV